LNAAWQNWRPRRDDGAKAEEEALRLSALVQSANDAIIGKTTKGIVQTWNSGAERLYGYSTAEMLGRDMTVILPPGRSDEEKKILEQIGRGERVEHFDTIRMRNDGRLIHVSIAISPITKQCSSWMTRISDDMACATN
jgi:PAS domain S-box-containing protein